MQQKKRKLCVYIVAQYISCQSNYQANSAWCPSRQKAKILACKNKTAKNLELMVKVITTPRLNIEERSSKVND